MLELFSDQPGYEYPQLINVAYSFAWSFVLASIIAITHRLTFTGERYPRNFFQSLVLGALITNLVMLAIGDSLARGLGVFGAMAIIRFRTRIDDPRDVLFLFAALSTGLAIGVYGYTISFVGTILFCVVAAILYFSPFKSLAQPNLLFFTLLDQTKLTLVNDIIRDYCNDFSIVSISVNKQNMLRYQYSISMKKEKSKDDLINSLRNLEGIAQPRITTNEIILP
jgi:uncharacterized membrane protein YhiD involved in acid resistance